MQVSQKQLPKSQVQIDVQLEPEEFEQHRGDAVASLAKEVKLEGFRPGHVPSAVAEKKLGEAAILSEVARLAITETYGKILEEQKLDVVGEPEVQIVKLAAGNPLEFQIKVAVLPEVELPEYKTIAKESEKRKVEIEEKEVDDALQWLKESRKTKDGLSGQEVTPEINDDFAKQVGNFENVAGLLKRNVHRLRHSLLYILHKYSFLSLYEQVRYLYFRFFSNLF